MVPGQIRQGLTIGRSGGGGVKICSGRDLCDRSVKSDRRQEILRFYASLLVTFDDPDGVVAASYTGSVGESLRFRRTGFGRYRMQVIAKQPNALIFET